MLTAFALNTYPNIAGPLLDQNAPIVSAELITLLAVLVTLLLAIVAVAIGGVEGAEGVDWSDKVDKVDARSGEVCDVRCGGGGVILFCVAAKKNEIN